MASTFDDPISSPTRSPGTFAAPRVKPKEHVARGTGFHAMVGWILFGIVGPILVLLTIVGTYGIALIAWLIALVKYNQRAKKAEAVLMGNGVKVAPDQFPAIYESVARMAGQLELKTLPDVYIIESNQQNAFALKIGSKQNIVLIDDIVYGALDNNNPEILDFIIGHELAHHALGHTGLFRGMISSHYKTLSRLDEFSCDAVSVAMQQNPQPGLDAMTLLAVGPRLYPRVDKASFAKQAQQVVSNKYSKKAESAMSHPLLLRRYGAIEAKS
ncbi:heat shock protein HtpX [Rosistilla oblonga]|uniref:Heat shock protein HtpX n=1 Tax=Rosistilla oblonga TaxID=2527990 RepID=A0A518IXE3_9BACT|nr:M48 family metallopeptidase [Rosistilla oblonga]QDV14051.1 heat shock protein HtpX [Rosistilla oblonga]QDV57757.1 heat shock protein HtpX [Rosistilla oblonga]